jgi:hypothetical protein
VEHDQHAGPLLDQQVEDEVGLVAAGVRGQLDDRPALDVGTARRLAVAALRSSTTRTRSPTTPTSARTGGPPLPS